MGKPSSPLISRLALALAGSILLGGLPLAGAQAQATIGYRYTSGAFGPFPSGLTGVAVDNSAGSIHENLAGDVYIADSGGEIRRFGAGGLPLPFPQGAKQLLVPGADRVAVDNSGDSSTGDLYVTVPGEGAAGAVEKVDIDGLGEPEPWVSGLASPTGIAVDGAGNVYVAQYSAGNVLEFSSAGKALNGGKPVVEGLDDPMGVAVDAQGDLYVANESAMGTVELKLAGGGGFSTAITVDPESGVDVAVDSSTGDVFIDGGEAVEQFNAAGELIGLPFAAAVGVLPLDSGGGHSSTVAESRATGDVYRTEWGPYSPDGGSEALVIAEPGEIPAAPITEPAVPPSGAETGGPNPGEAGAVGGTLPAGSGSGATHSDTPAATLSTPSSGGPAVSSKLDLSTVRLLTGAQIRAGALKACGRRPKRQRAGCERRMEKRSGARSRKEGMQSRRTGEKDR
jgi:hypothetical protein